MADQEPRRSIPAFLRLTQRPRSTSAFSASADRSKPSASAFDRLSDFLANANAAKSSHTDAIASPKSAAKTPTSSTSIAFLPESVGPYDATPPSAFLDALANCTSAKQKLTLFTQLDVSVRTSSFPQSAAIWADCAKYLEATESLDIRLAALTLLEGCIGASETGIPVTAVEKMHFYLSVAEYQIPFDQRTKEEHRRLTTALCSLTKGGKSILGLEQLPDLLFQWVADLFAMHQSEREYYAPTVPAAAETSSQATFSPITDPTFSTPFVRLPHQAGMTKPAENPMALLIAIHQFSFPHIKPETVSQITGLFVNIASASSSETDVELAMDFLHKLAIYGYVPTDQLEDSVELLARVSSLNQNLAILEVNESGDVHSKKLGSALSKKALETMSKLTQSPSNQVLRIIKLSLQQAAEPDAPIDLPLVVGTVRSIRQAFLTYDEEVASSLSDTTIDRPSLLSIGLPYVQEQLQALCDRHRRVEIDTEILALIEERLTASVARAGVMASQKNGEQGAKEVISWAEWDTIIQMLGKVQVWVAEYEKKARSHWTIGMRELSRTNEPIIQEKASVYALLLSRIERLFSRILADFKAGTFSGSIQDLTELCFSYTPYLSDEHFNLIFDFSSTNSDSSIVGNITQSADWLERLHNLVNMFLLPQVSDHPRISPAKAQARLIALQIVTDTYIASRDTAKDQIAIIQEVVMPIIKTVLPKEYDPVFAVKSVALLDQIVKDCLESATSAEERPFKTTFEEILEAMRAQLRTLITLPSPVSPIKADPLSKLRRKSTISKSGPSNSPTRQELFRELHQHSFSMSAHEEAIATPTTAQTAEDPDIRQLMQEFTTQLGTPDIADLAALSIVSLFTECIAISNRQSSSIAVSVFQECLQYLAPPMPSSDSTPPPQISRQARFTILQFIVRIRADQKHRIFIRRTIHFESSAAEIGRIVDESQPAASTSQLVVEQEDDNKPHGRADARGRKGRASGVAPASTKPSRSRSRMERSPSRARATPTSDMLWSIPEILSFNMSESVRPKGQDCLVSFDHARLQDWTEVGDSAEDSTTQEMAASMTSSMIVLPSSEYLATMIQLLQTETNWEFVSYILCTIPLQLSNKHFFCGPRAARLLHILRRHLCDTLQRDKFAEQVIIPTALRRSDIHALAHGLLVVLVAYRDLFNISHRNEIIQTFVGGLAKGPQIAKPSLHALFIACHEMPDTVTKYLTQTLLSLVRMMSTPTMAVHILEFLGSVGQIPALWANFTDDDFRQVFGLALQYIALHFQRLADNPAQSSQPPEDYEGSMAYGFAQYVFLLAFYVITLWYMSIRQPERYKYVPFIISRLVTANSSDAKTQDTVAVEVCLDMIRRYAYSDADPRPRPMLGSMLTISDPGKLSKTWALPDSFITIETTASTAVATIRRASGTVRLNIGLDNVMRSDIASDALLQARLQQSQDQKSLASSSPTVVRTHLRSASQPITPPSLHQSTFPANSRRPSLQVANTDELRSEPPIVQGSARYPAEDTIIDPAFYLLQMLSLTTDITQRPVIVANEIAARSLDFMDRIQVVDAHRIGVVYVAPGQVADPSSSEPHQALLNDLATEILANTYGSNHYQTFLEGLGKLVRLKDCKDVYVAGLDTISDVDGKWMYSWADNITQICFETATMMPTDREKDPQCNNKRRHIGNDYVRIIFNESGGPYEFHTIQSQFNFVNIIIEPHTPAGNPWRETWMSNNAVFFRVHLQRRPGMPEIGPLGSFKMVSADCLPQLVRQLCLHANIFAQVWGASVGMESVHNPGKRVKTPYISSWRHRLDHIKLTRQRAFLAQQERIQKGTMLEDDDPAANKVAMRDFTPFTTAA